MKKPTLAERLAESLATKAGVFPVTDQPAVWLQGSWVSLPHLSYGNWPPHRQIDGQAPINIAASSWEWRGVSSTTESAYKTASWLDLKAPQHFSNQLERKIKRAHQSPFTWERGGIELLSEFWEVYARHLHRLGSLPLPKRFFSVLLSGFKEGFAEIFLLRWQGKVVGGACNIYIEGFYENGWFATNREAQQKYGSYLLHDVMIKRAQALQAEVYSFGRSTANSGVHRFKQQWGTQDIGLLWVKNGERLQGSYALKPMGLCLKYLPFAWVAYLGARLYKYIY
jgi:hypothetical protein